MRVLFRRASVRSPASVADSVIAIDRIQTQNVFEIAKFPRRAADSQGLIVTVDGESGRVVASIFKPFQSIQDDRHGALRTDVTHDSAHGYIVRSMPISRYIEPELRRARNLIK